MKRIMLTRLLPAVIAAAVLIALHVIFTFNNITSWMLAVVASEYGHRFAAILFLISLVCWRAGRRTLAVTGVVTGLVFLWPLAQSVALSKKVNVELLRVFGRHADDATVQLRTASLLFGTCPEKISPQVMTYAGEGGEKQSLYFFRAIANRPAPCIVLLHGGGWEKGTANEFPDWSSYWARSGYAVASVQYRLAPRHPWPAQREDVALALNFLKGKAAEIGIDATRFVFLGRSAGAQLAVACAYGMQDPSVRGCISFYGPQDMFFARKYALKDDVLNSLRMVRNFMGGDPEQVPDSYSSASGILLARPDSPPALIFHGTRDIIVWNRHSQRFAARLEELGVRHVLVELPWAAHGFDWCYDGIGGQIARDAVDCFLRKVTG